MEERRQQTNVEMFFGLTTFLVSPEAVREQERLRRELRQLRDGCVSSSHTSLRLQRELTAWQVAVKSLSTEEQLNVTELMKKHYSQSTADISEKEKG